jgi:alkaline phosphatase D
LPIAGSLLELFSPLMPTPDRKLTRRRFLSNSAALAAGAAVASRLPTPLRAGNARTPAAEFVANWKQSPDRVWLGPEFWSNPLQDWRIANGRIECTNAAGDRNVHLLVRSLADQDGDFAISVRVARPDGSALGKATGSVGFRIGIRGPLPDYRSGLIYGRGLDAGLTSEGGLFIGAIGEAKAGTVKLDAAEVQLQLTGTPAAGGYTLKLTASNAQGAELGSVLETVPRERLVGGIALVNNFAPAGPAAPRVAARRAGSACSRLPTGASVAANSTRIRIARLGRCCFPNTPSAPAC